MAEVSGETLLGYVDAQLGFGPRFPGSPGHARMKTWLDSMARARAPIVEIDDWTQTTARGDILHLRNVLARFHPEFPHRVLYLAHWDTRPKADGPSSRDSTAPIPGANDGASGVAILLGVADALQKRPPSVGVDLLFVDGEDYGSFQDSTETLLGARRYAATLTGARPKFAIVWDMLGDRELRLQQEGYSLLAAPDLVARIWNLGRRLGYGGHLGPQPGRPIIDDHLPLQAVGIPTVDLIDLEYGPGNAWHHTAEDTRDKLSPASLALAAHLATALVREEH